MTSTYVRVHAAPGMKHERVVRESDDTYRISVREPAERNLANTRIRELVAREFGVPVAAVRMVNGHRSPSKLLRIETRDR